MNRMGVIIGRAVVFFFLITYLKVATADEIFSIEVGASYLPNNLISDKWYQEHVSSVGLIIGIAVPINIGFVDLHIKVERIRHRIDQITFTVDYFLMISSSLRSTNIYWWAKNWSSIASRSCLRSASAEQTKWEIPITMGLQYEIITGILGFLFVFVVMAKSYGQVSYSNYREAFMMSMLVTSDHHWRLKQLW